MEDTATLIERGSSVLSALFRELIQTYSPWEAVVETLEAAPGLPPAELMPKVTALGSGFELIRRRLGRVALAMRRERPSSQDRARG